jgi:hypothetical protein
MVVSVREGQRARLPWIKLTTKNEVTSLPAEDQWLVATSHKYPQLYYAPVRCCATILRLRSGNFLPMDRFFRPNLPFGWLKGLTLNDFHSVLQQTSCTNYKHLADSESPHLFVLFASDYFGPFHLVIEKRNTATAPPRLRAHLRTLFVNSEAPEEFIYNDYNLPKQTESAMAVSSIQDRTNEFRSVLAQVQKRQASTKVGTQRQSLLTDSQKVANGTAHGDAKQRKSEFARRAAEIGRGISATMAKLEKLTQRMSLSTRMTLTHQPLNII